ncbi:hypothetical protein ACFSTI_27675 [Rhizorhabdus histidinilytica]
MEGIAERSGNRSDRHRSAQKQKEIRQKTKRAARAALSVHLLDALALRAVAATAARGRNRDADASCDTRNCTGDTEATETATGTTSTTGTTSARVGSGIGTFDLSQLNGALACDLLVEARDNTGPHLRANRLHGGTAQRGSGFGNSRSNRGRDQRSNRKRRSNFTKALHNRLLTRSTFP